MTHYVEPAPQPAPRTDIIRRWSAPGGALSLGDRLRTALPADVLSLLTLAGNTASHMGASLFLVGGFVRDLLLGLPNYDLDLVVEGDAIALAQRLAAAPARCPAPASGELCSARRA